MEQPEKEQATFMADMARETTDPARRFLGGKAYDGSRPKEETELFYKGLGVMSNIYASPRMLVGALNRGLYRHPRFVMPRTLDFSVARSERPAFESLAAGVLVLQQKQIPRKLDMERCSYGHSLPAIRLDLIPYAGRDCRSGWCTFECASMVHTDHRPALSHISSPRSC